MANFSCPEKFIAIGQQFHDDILIHVVDDDESSEQFAVTSGVKEGCVLAPTLFNMMLSVMLTYAVQDCDIGIDIRYQTDGKIFNLRQLQAKKKLQEVTVHDLLLDDDFPECQI
ncbi:hypothetical protein Y1Q_0010288 [Alligator mississippiensis]|uniref:Reverse transcriptase domain-containing protein n=1 Tax=Alligator mississippiensis TaxID=8496 RepID=A0A151NM21_ALLMI|nr:hypothetical protein Y1Q_0010288 [Alligator mississippiensis]